MRVELLVVPGCPHEAVARDRLRRALADTGRPDAPVEVRTVTEETAGAVPGFAGSPTVLLDGVDPFAAQAPGPVGPSCRIYRTGSGTDGAPSVEQLREALQG